MFNKEWKNTWHGNVKVNVKDLFLSIKKKILQVSEAKIFKCIVD